MQWKLRHIGTQTCIPQMFEDRSQADLHLVRMGAAFKSLYEAIPDTPNPKHFRMLTEGLTQGDLRRIILPQISIDEYVPGDPETDNIVIAFFIRGVPEAVIPFRDFVMKCKGVLDVAYGESETIPNTSIIYAEMAREAFRFEDLNVIMKQVGLLSQLDPADFTVVFPTSERRNPYGKDVIMNYFSTRSIQKNWEDQQKALQQTKNQDDPDAGDQSEEQPQEPQA